MVHSIEFTKIWTNIYSKTHPQGKHFSSKQVTYGWQSLCTNSPKVYLFSSLQRERKKKRKKKKSRTLPLHFKSRDLFNAGGNGPTHNVDYCKPFRSHPGTWGEGPASAGTRPPGDPGCGQARVPVGSPGLSHLFNGGIAWRQPLGGCISNLSQPSLQATPFPRVKNKYFLSCTIRRKTASEEKVAAGPR